MRSVRLPLCVSIAGHAACLALLILLLSDKALPVPEPIAKGGIELVFQPQLPKSETTSPSAPTLQPEIPPPRKPIAKKPPKPVQRHEEPPQPNQAYLPAAPTPPTPAIPPQTASAATPAPAPVPSPGASAGYRALLSAWLESHKRYPDTARQRGEEGNAVLRFEVDRNGHVIAYTVAKSSGYPDLDESVEAMMRGATLPPFPAEMPQPRMEVSVTIRFSLRR